VKAMTQKLTETVKLDKATKKRLERLKKGEFKRRYKVRSINDVIKKLLEIWDEYQIIKAETSEKSEKSEKYEETVLLKEEIQDICYNCANYSFCACDWKHKPEEVKEHGCFKPRNQCVFRSERPDGKIDCAKDFAKSGKIHIVTKEFCDKCWERKQKARELYEKRKRELEMKLMKKNIHETAERIRKREEQGIFCVLKNRYFKDLMQLPCIENPMFSCPNEECHKKILEKMKE